MISDSQLTLTQLDQQITEAFDKLMANYNIDPDAESSKDLKYKHLAKIQEEIGELAEQILKSDDLQRKEKGAFVQSELEEELGDAIFALLFLAKTLKIDIAELIAKRFEKDQY